MGWAGSEKMLPGERGERGDVCKIRSVESEYVEGVVTGKTTGYGSFTLDGGVFGSLEGNLDTPHIYRSARQARRVLGRCLEHTISIYIRRQLLRGKKQLVMGEFL